MVKERTISQLRVDYNRAKTRSTRMKVHWRLAKKISDEMGVDISSSRRGAREYVRGIELGTGKYLYRHAAVIMLADGSEKGITVGSAKKLSEREVKRRVGIIIEKNKERYKEFPAVVDIGDIKDVFVPERYGEPEPEWEEMKEVQKKRKMEATKEKAMLLEKKIERIKKK